MHHSVETANDQHVPTAPSPQAVKEANALKSTTIETHAIAVKPTKIHTDPVYLRPTNPSTTRQHTSRYPTSPFQQFPQPCPSTHPPLPLPLSPPLPLFRSQNRRAAVCTSKSKQNRSKQLFLSLLLRTEEHVYRGTHRCLRHPNAILAEATFSGFKVPGRTTKAPGRVHRSQNHK